MLDLAWDWDRASLVCIYTAGTAVSSNLCAIDGLYAGWWLLPTVSIRRRWRLMSWLVNPMTSLTSLWCSIIISSNSSSNYDLPTSCMTVTVPTLHTHRGGLASFSWAPSLLPPSAVLSSLPSHSFLPSTPIPFDFPPLLSHRSRPFKYSWGLEKRWVSQQGLRQSPSRDRIWCMLALKSDIWWH